MIDNGKLPVRRSIRLKGYDYSQEGAYFVTICTHKHLLLFEDEEIKRIIDEAWLNTANLRSNIALDEFIVMPNHVHGIIFIKQQVKNNADVGAYCRTPLKVSKKGNVNLQHVDQERANINSPLQQPHCRLRGPSHTIGSIIRGFKSSISMKINMLRRTPRAPVWQRNYYDHVIRDERDLYKIRKYIRENPLKWEIDRENPVNL